MSLWLGIGIFLLAINLGLWLFLAMGWSMVPLESLKTGQDYPAISIIVAAKDEASNLPDILESFASLEYPCFEIVIVLDRCTDESEEIVKQFQSRLENLRYLKIDSLPENWSGKKFAIQSGIREANYECLAFTDADCTVPKTWLLHIGEKFLLGADIVLGIGAYKVEKGLLNRFIRYETFLAAVQYIGMAAWQRPYMAVGRNLAYKKDFFNKHQGFSGFEDSLSGDDDLLVNAYGGQHKMGMVILPAGQTFSTAKSTLRSWYFQKTRHVSASNLYSFSSRLFLGLFHLSHQFLYLLVIIGILYGHNTWAWLALIGLRIAISWIILHRLNRRTKWSGLLYTYPILDLFFFLYNLLLVPIGLIKKPSWQK